MIADGVRLMLGGLGLDLDSPHLRDTPKRVAKAWHDELCAGLTKPPPNITTFPHEAGEDAGMIISHEIPIHSMCEHHLLPFIGTAVVAYIPGGDEILGLSKLSRLTDFYARRPQVQERLTAMIADGVWEFVKGPKGQLGDGGVGVVVRARHSCMELRGVKHSGLMQTSALRGVFHDAEVRAEFLALTRRGERNG